MGDSENKMRFENHHLAKMEKVATSYGAAKLIEDRVQPICQTLMARSICLSTCQSPFQTIKAQKSVIHQWVDCQYLSCHFTQLHGMLM